MLVTADSKGGYTEKATSPAGNPLWLQIPSFCFGGWDAQPLQRLSLPSDGVVLRGLVVLPTPDKLRHQRRAQERSQESKRNCIEIVHFHSTGNHIEVQKLNTFDSQSPGDPSLKGNFSITCESGTPCFSY